MPHGCPLPLSDQEPARKKERNGKIRSIHHASCAKGITNTHTNCSPYIVHPTQTTTNYHSVSRHTDGQNNSVVVATVNILHICQNIVCSMSRTYVLFPNGRTTRPRDLRERADMSVRRPGLGARLLATSDEARAGWYIARLLSGSFKRVSAHRARDHTLESAQQQLFYKLTLLLNRQ